jgi:hypothetical protein
MYFFSLSLYHTTTKDRFFCVTILKLTQVVGIKNRREKEGEREQKKKNGRRRRTTNKYEFYLT